MTFLAHPLRTKRDPDMTLAMTKPLQVSRASVLPNFCLTPLPSQLPQGQVTFVPWSCGCVTRTPICNWVTLGEQYTGGTEKLSGPRILLRKPATTIPLPTPQFLLHYLTISIYFQLIHYIDISISCQYQLIVVDEFATLIRSRHTD